MGPHPPPSGPPHPFALAPDATADATLDALRLRWRTLIGDALPAMARERPDWPIRLDHCFARVVLDAVHGRPWREVLRPPAWRTMDVDTLTRAVATAEAIVDGSLDLVAANARSLALRGESRRRR